MQTPPPALDERGTLTILYSGKTHGGISAFYQISDIRALIALVHSQ